MKLLKATVLFICSYIILALGNYWELMSLVLHWQVIAEACTNESEAVMNWILLNAQGNLVYVCIFIDLLNSVLFILVVTVIIGLLFLSISFTSESYILGLLVGSSLSSLLTLLAPSIPVVQGVSTINVVSLLAYINLSFYVFESFIFIIVLLVLLIIYIIWCLKR